MKKKTVSLNSSFLLFFLQNKYCDIKNKTYYRENIEIKIIINFFKGLSITRTWQLLNTLKDKFVYNVFEIMTSKLQGSQKELM
jgi:hypothetical protein